LDDEGVSIALDKISPEFDEILVEEICVELDNRVLEEERSLISPWLTIPLSVQDVKKAEKNNKTLKTFINIKSSHKKNPTSLRGGIRVNPSL
jgi:hypothetical protein